MRDWLSVPFVCAIRREVKNSVILLGGGEKGLKIGHRTGFEAWHKNCLLRVINGLENGRKVAEGSVSLSESLDVS